MKNAKKELVHFRDWELDTLNSKLLNSQTLELHTLDQCCYTVQVSDTTGVEKSSSCRLTKENAKCKMKNGSSFTFVYPILETSNPKLFFVLANSATPVLGG